MFTRIGLFVFCHIKTKLIYKNKIGLFGGNSFDIRVKKFYNKNVMS